MNIEQRLEKLERTIRLWRLLSITASSFLAIIVCLGATGPEKNGGEFVLEKLVIRDSQGQARIVLGTSPDGATGFTHYDAKG